MGLSNKIIVIAGLFVFVWLGLAAIRPMHDVPKNLKVLPKDISEDSLYHIMEGFERSLGVKCGFCHVMRDANGKEDYAIDALPAKDACRNMMRMTMDINKKYFPADTLNQVITCYTCHRGQQEPRLKSDSNLWQFKN